MGHFCNWYPPGRGSVLQKMPQEASHATLVVGFQLLDPMTWLRLRLLKRKPRDFCLFLFGEDEGRGRRFQTEWH